ncbi:MAG TPA: cupin domain-containing protein [Myxococcaceae bacterium]|jgi:quercetin dioxygenase-like cupin family protein|nr:cupin domain-containing protein [Myxococcaceae bacterium]
MNVRHLSEMTGFSDQKLQKLGVFQTERLFVDVYCLRPGQAQKVHAHPGSDKVYVVLDGRCRFTVDAETAEHGPGAAVLAPAGVPHGVENASGSDARLLVVISPPPAHG